MDRYLITGFSGFVSEHFLDYLQHINASCTVLGIDIEKPEFEIKQYAFDIRFEKLDLLNKAGLKAVLKKYQPNYILHLASYSSVAFSWENPGISYQNNTNIFLNLLEVVRNLNLSARILSIGSSEEYGNVAENDLPLIENSMLNPVSPYAVARVSQEMLSKVYVTGFNLDIILTRSFNHFGPKQRDVFVIPSFVKQMVTMATNKNEKILTTGDTEIIRDFVDVRDVVRAYYLLFKHGTAGEVYNVCKGEGYSLSDIIDQIAIILNVKIKQKINYQLIRPNDNRIIIGSNKKIKEAINWTPKISLKESLKDIINYWQIKLNQNN